MLRHLRILIEFIAAFLGVILLVVAALIWRLSSSPINSTFMTPYIESGIERYIPDSHAQIDNTLLTWDNIDHSVALHADGVVVKNSADQMIAEVPNLDLRLSPFGLLFGQFWPVELTVDHPQIKLNRHADGRLYFASMQTTSDVVADPADTRETLKRTMYNLTRAYTMRHLIVKRAVVEIHNDVSNGVWSVSIPEISLTRNFTQLTGLATIDLTQKDQTASLEVRYSYDHIQHLHRFSSRFQDITPAQLAGGHPDLVGLGDAAMLDLPLSGEVEVALDSDLMIAAAAANLHGGSGVLHVPALWDKPRPVKSVEVEGDFDQHAHKLNLTTAAFDFGGPRLNVTASGHKPEDAKKYDLDFTLGAHIENWSMDRFKDLWPNPVVPNAREWMADNLSKGNYDVGDASFKGSLAWSHLDDMVMTSGEGKINASHGSVVYIQGMPPVEDVRAEAHFDLNQMTLQISDGGIGNLRLQPFTATITGLADDTQHIDIPLKLVGPIPDVIALIDHEPLRYAHSVGLSPTMLDGYTEGTVRIRLPLLKAVAMTDVDVTAMAQLSNVASTQLIKGVDLAQGLLTLNLDKDGLQLKGGLNINKLPFQLTAQQLFHEQPNKPLRQVDVSGSIKDDQWKALGVDLFTGTRGMGLVTLNITQPNKFKTILSGSLDFAAADLHFEPLNWRKVQGVPALLQFDAETAEGKDIVVKSLSLRSPLARAQGKMVVSAEGHVKSASLEPLVVGRTNANIRFSQTEGDDGALRFDVRGKSLDVSGLKGGKEPAHADKRSKDYHLDVEKLYTSDNGMMTKVTGSAVRDSLGWSAISFHGLADGEHKLDINLTPQPDATRTFSITCDDFGKMLKGLGFTDTVKEGEVKIEGASTPESPRVINGTLDIGSFSVGKLPVLALLLNATSPFGFVGLVTDSASFEHMRGSFRWTGDQLDLQHINAAGNSVGMNINGKVDMNSGMANLNGTLVPFSMVNRILGSIPLLGDLLTGGDGGGVLAVAYNIKGSLSNPNISVNPVSLLTPGFLRNLFFGGDDTELPQAE